MISSALSIFSISEFFSLLLPIMSFVLVFAALLFLMYLRSSLEANFRALRDIAASLREIAAKLSEKRE